MPSIIIPAHNEAVTIGALLTSLAPLADETEVVVICNGCSDATASCATLAAPWATVIELKEASKPLALNMGDSFARSFPRLYLDADIRISVNAVRELFAAIQSGALSAAATPIYDLSRSSFLVRSHFSIWSRMPANMRGLSGVNAVAVSQQGRARFSSWPRFIGDDYFLDGQFSADEKQRVPSATVVRAAPLGARDCISRKARVHQGNVDVRKNGLRSLHTGGGLSGALSVVRRHPALVVHLPAHLMVTVAARLLVHWRRRRGTEQSWYRDKSRIAV